MMITLTRVHTNLTGNMRNGEEAWSQYPNGINFGENLKTSEAEM